MSEKYASQWREAVGQPQGVRAKLRHRLRGGLLSTLFWARQARAGSFLRCIYCHYVFDDQAERFDRLVAALCEIGTFVDTDTCVRMAQGEQPIDGKCFHLSFDDGFRNNFTNALPVLRRRRVPGLFFVPSGLVGADYELARHYCLETTDYTGVIEMMRWPDLEALLDAGCEIGSHTRTHARFSEVSGDPAALESEILGSKKDLEAKLGFDCKYISWPFGTLSDADARSLEMVRQSGYAACFGAFRGNIEPGKTPLYAIPRHHFEVQWPRSHVLYFAAKW